MAILLDPKAPGGQQPGDAKGMDWDRILSSGTTGAMIGGGVGALRNLLAGRRSEQTIPGYLRNTLAGALIGGVGGGGAEAIGLLKPWHQATPLASAIGSVGETSKELMADPTQLAGSRQDLMGLYMRRAIEAAALAKGDLTPEEQTEFANKMLTSKLPTSRGFRNRIDHLRNIADQLKGGGMGAGYNIATAKRFIRDPQTRALLDQAQQTLRAGGMWHPEQSQLLAGLGKRISERIPAYGQTAQMIEELQDTRKQYTAGDFSEQDAARRMADAMGRFTKPRGGGEGARTSRDIRGILGGIMDEPLKTEEGTFPTPTAGTYAPWATTY